MKSNIKLGTTSEMLLLRVGEQWILTEIAIYLRNGPRPLRDETRRCYHRWIKVFLRMAGANGEIPFAELLTKVNLIRCLCQISCEQQSKRRNFLFAVKALARFSGDMCVISPGEAEAIAKVTIKSKRSPPRQCPEPEQIDRILRFLLVGGDYDPIERITNLAIFCCLAHSGLRNEELCTLAKDNVNFDDGIIHVVNAKGGKNRTIGLSRRLEPLLRLYSRYRPESDTPYFFVGPKGTALKRDLIIKRFQRISALSGIKICPHQLRHAWASAVAARGVPLHELQQALGHSDLATTAIYLHVNKAQVAASMRDWL